MVLVLEDLRSLTVITTKMGQEQSTLQKEGYNIEKETENYVIATKDSDKFFIRKIKVSTNAALISEMEKLKTINHPHVMNTKNFIKDEDGNTYFVVMEFCEGGSLVKKSREGRQQEFEVLSWIVEICMALRAIHDKDLLHKGLMPQNILLTEFGTVRLSGFWNIEENSNNPNERTAAVNYLAPEVFTQALNYDARSEIWSVGCILNKLCTSWLPFSAETTVSLISKITSGPDPHLQGEFSPEFCELLSDMLKQDPDSRPTAWEILGRPITLRCLTKKCETTTKHLQAQLDKLKAVADSLERVHTGTTIVSLTGGVIGAAGGITSLVGLALAPFTFGASLVVSGIGIGVGVAGGVTAGASNITNMVNQASDRKVVHSIIKEFDEKINAVASWLQEISNSLQTIRNQCSGELSEDGSLNPENWVKFGTRLGKGLGNVTQLFRLIRVVNIGKTAAQASRALRVAEVAGGALAGLFVAADVFFIAMDAKEIHHIRQTQAGGKTHSEIMKFVQSIRCAAKELQEVLNELKSITSTLPFLEDKRELEWQEMEGILAE